MSVVRTSVATGNAPKASDSWASGPVALESFSDMSGPTRSHVAIIELPLRHCKCGQSNELCRLKYKYTDLHFVRRYNSPFIVAPGGTQAQTCESLHISFVLGIRDRPHPLLNRSSLARTKCNVDRLVCIIQVNKCITSTANVGGVLKCPGLFAGYTDERVWITVC